MKIKVQQPNPDGLDEVFHAYQLLRKVYAAGEYVEVDYDTPAGPHTEVILKLPGVEGYIDPDDENPLTGLERWLVEHGMKVGEEL